VPGVKPPAQVTASHCQCLGTESDGQLVQAQLADWALNTSSPEGLQLPKEAVFADRLGPEQELARRHDGASEEIML